MDAAFTVKQIIEIAKPIIGIYRGLILKWPLASVVVAALAGVVYVTFAMQPEVESLDIDIMPTEQYEFEELNFKIQRINLTTNAQSLQAVRIRIELPMVLELHKFHMNPQLPFSFDVNKFGDDRTVFDFSCSSFDENQRAQLIFGTSKAVSREELVKVEVSGLTEEGQRISKSEERTLWSL